MILREIETFMTQHKEASLEQIAKELNQEPAYIQNAMDYWVQKGKVKILKPSDFCSGCSSDCSSCLTSSKLIIYQWIIS